MKLTPLKFLPEEAEMPWGSAAYKLADLGFVDSTACEGYLKGNTLSDIMQTYLERVVGDASFEWYGTQFPVLVKRLEVKGRTSLHVTADDEAAEQRYDAFGKTALWYVEKAGTGAKLYLGFKKPVTSEQFFRACQDGSVEGLLHTVTPKAGEWYLITPGLVHAAAEITLLEIAECSELWFRLWDWGATDREIHLEEAFDLIDFKGKGRAAGSGSVVTPQFTVNRITLNQALKSTRDGDDTFLIYLCTKGAAQLQAEKTPYHIRQGEIILVPAEVREFFLLPEAPDTELLEVRMDPRQDDDIVSEEADGGTD